MSYFDPAGGLRQGHHSPVRRGPGVRRPQYLIAFCLTFGLPIKAIGPSTTCVRTCALAPTRTSEPVADFAAWRFGDHFFHCSAGSKLDGVTNCLGRHNNVSTTEQITQVNTQYTQLDNKVETLETQYAQLDLKSNILANGVISLLGNMNDVLPSVLALEQNTTTIFYKSAELPLSQYENGKMLTVFHPMGYDPLRVIMKARDVQSGFVYTVNPGSDYGFNYRHATGFNTTQSRNIEVAIGSAGLFLMTNSGSRRNVLTGQRRGWFNIYAIMEFITSPPRNLPQNEIWQSNPYADDSLNF